MNKVRLNQLFSNYIEKFEYINNPDNNETYKWAAVEQYRESFNLEAPDLPGMLYEAWKASENLIDSANQQPFYALVSYAKEEPETVRKMFRDLFADDGGNLAERQEKIIAFIQSSEELKAKYAPGSWRYTNDQRSVMAYLFFHDPEHNYLYKATQAHEFADCVEFLDDWGAGANFKLDVYPLYITCMVGALQAVLSGIFRESLQSRSGCHGGSVQNRARKDPVTQKREYIRSIEHLGFPQGTACFGKISFRFRTMAVIMNTTTARGIAESLPFPADFTQYLEQEVLCVEKTTWDASFIGAGRYIVTVRVCRRSGGGAPGREWG